MGSRKPDFAALAEEAYEAADAMVDHFEKCPYKLQCCEEGKALVSKYHRKRDKALKAIRGRKK